MRRDELMRVALGLFGARGYRATSVADIQRAAGLTGGSGALYKHFPSKKDLLTTAIRQYVRGLGDSSSDLSTALPADPEAALTMMSSAVLDAMAKDRDLIRIGLRDLDDVPDLQTELWDGLLASLYRELASWIRTSDFPVADPDATAAVLVASLTYFRVLEALIGHTPGDVDATAYQRAWVASALATLGRQDRATKS